MPNALWMLGICSGLQLAETHSKIVLISGEAGFGRKSCSFPKWGKVAHSDAGAISNP